MFTDWFILSRLSNHIPTLEGTAFRGSQNVGISRLFHTLSMFTQP